VRRCGPRSTTMPYARSQATLQLKHDRKLRRRRGRRGGYKLRSIAPSVHPVGWVLVESNPAKRARRRGKDASVIPLYLSEGGDWRVQMSAWRTGGTAIFVSGGHGRGELEDRFRDTLCGSAEERWDRAHGSRAADYSAQPDFATCMSLCSRRSIDALRDQRQTLNRVCNGARVVFD